MLSAVLLAVLPVVAPDAPLSLREAAPLSLSEAAAMAAGEAPAVVRARAETEGARAREIAARSRLGPTLTFDAGFLTTDDPVDAFGLALKQQRFSASEFFASDPNHPGWTRDWNGMLSAAWTADLFGVARGQARAAAEAARASERAARRTRDAVVLQAVAAFAAARRAQEAVAILSERETDARKDVESAASFEEQGLTTSADPARTRAALAEIRAETAGERAALEEARASLAALIGAGAARRPLAALPEPRPVPAAPTGERDDVAAAELAAKAARDAEKSAAASRWPSLTLQARYETHAPRPGDHWGDSAAVSGGFRVPLFSSGAIRSRLAEARAARLSAEASAVEIRRASEKQIASARAALDAADARFAAFTEAETSARRAREIYQARYGEGVARLSDLLEARSAEVRARLGVSAAKSERLTAQANLRLALGLPPEGGENP